MTEIDQRANTVSASALRVYFPQGTPVSVVIAHHGRGRSGSSRTRLTVLAVTSTDRAIGNVSGMVASATGYGAHRDESSSVIVSGYGNPEHAASALIRELAVILWGRENALRLAVI